jgi:hypothetical protein
MLIYLVKGVEASLMVKGEFLGFITCEKYLAGSYVVWCLIITQLSSYAFGTLRHRDAIRCSRYFLICGYCPTHWHLLITKSLPPFFWISVFSAVFFRILVVRLFFFSWYQTFPFLYFDDSTSTLETQFNSSISEFHRMGTNLWDYIALDTWAGSWILPWSRSTGTS